MFVPKRFAVDDLAALDALLARDAFVTLVSQVDGAPFASHLPVLYRREGAAVRFVGHWARANPQWRGIEAQTVLLVVHGPHAYVSPSWYAHPETSVPTWNYAVAHVHGRVELIEGAAELAGLVAELAAHYERAVGSAWRFPDSAPGTRAELAGIVGFELTAQRIAIKHKLNQHHDDASIAGAVRGLRGRGDPGSLEIAGLMAAARSDRGRLAAGSDPAAPDPGPATP
jgi:transcriptional regulator